MLKYLAAIVLVFLLAVYVSVQDERAAQQATTKASQIDKGTFSAETDEDHPDQNAPNPKRYAPRWFRFFRWGDGTTTWVIVLTLLAIAEQAKESAKATRAMRDSLPLQQQAAEAAKKSADTAIASERGWVTVTIEWAPGHAGLFTGDHTQHGITTPNCRVTIRMIYKNDGKTPVWITERRAGMNIYPLFDGLPDRPPMADDVIAVGVVSLAAGQEKSVDTPLECKGRGGMENLTVIYAIVRYRTVIPTLNGESISGYDVAVGGKTLRPLENAGWNSNT
jgi:hypothetical protein